MRRLLKSGSIGATFAGIAAIGLVSCGRAAAPAEDGAAANEVTAAWAGAFDSGNAAAIARCTRKMRTRCLRAPDLSPGAP